jgi:hypothetical protein
MLHQTAAAAAGVGAGWADPVRRRAKDAGIQQPVTGQIAFNHLSREHLWHEHRAFRTLRNTIAAMAKPPDSQDHSAASF